MKKILFGSIAAICAVASFSSFEHIHRFFGPHYFYIKLCVNIPTGIGATVAPSQVTYAGSLPSSCSGAGSGYDCVVSFTQHVNAAGTKLTQAAQISSTLYTRAPC